MILPPSFFWIHRITSESENPLPLLPALPIATIPSKCYNKFAEILQTLNKKEEMNMLDPKVAELLNTQVNKEFYSAYLYLDFANYYKDQGLDGFANWYNIQAQEERDHAMLFIQYLQNNGEKVTLESIDKPEAVLAGFEDPLKAGLEHEQYVTSLIHAIYDAAYAQKDFRTMQFLDWFVKEQGEEEKNADDLITKFNLFGHDSRSLYMLDSELAARVYSAPSLVL
jgi:ferritin